MSEDAKKLELYEWTIREIVEKMMEEDHEKYANKLYEATYNTSELSFKRIKTWLEDTAEKLKKIKEESILKNQPSLFAMGLTLEIALGWIKMLLDALIIERAMRWGDEVMMSVVLGRPLGEIIQGLGSEISELKKRPIEAKVEISEKFEETFEWLQEKMKAEKRKDKASKEMVA